MAMEHTLRLEITLRTRCEDHVGVRRIHELAQDMRAAAQQLMSISHDTLGLFELKVETTHDPASPQADLHDSL